MESRMRRKSLVRFGKGRVTLLIRLFHLDFFIFYHFICKKIVVCAMQDTYFNRLYTNPVNSKPDHPRKLQGIPLSQPVLWPVNGYVNVYSGQIS